MKEHNTQLSRPLIVGHGRVCSHDGRRLVEIGTDISEQLDIVPQQVRVIQHHRVKHACPCCDNSIRVTPAPARIIPKGLLTETALAKRPNHTITAKPLFVSAQLRLSKIAYCQSQNLWLFVPREA